MEKVFLIHLCVTAALCGLIWLVQLTHYPLFRYLDPSRFQEAMVVHQSMISWIVIPLMLTELGLSLLTLHIPSLIIVALIWISTFLIHVPLHDRLARSGHDFTSINKLVRTNWIRTFLWSLKFIILYQA